MIGKNKKAAVMGAAAWLDGNYLSTTKRPGHALRPATGDFRTLVTGGNPVDMERGRHGWSLLKPTRVGQAAERFAQTFQL
jgi:hypothetical protein